VASVVAQCHPPPKLASQRRSGRVGQEFGLRRAAPRNRRQRKDVRCPRLGERKSPLPHGRAGRERRQLVKTHFDESANAGEIIPGNRQICLWKRIIAVSCQATGSNRKTKSSLLYSGARRRDHVKFDPKALSAAAKRFFATKSKRDLNRLIAARQIDAYAKKRKGRRLTASNAWQSWELDLLGAVTDLEVARITGRTHKAVSSKRISLRILARGPYLFWRKNEEALLGAMPDREAAKQLGRSLRAVQRRRHELRIPATETLARIWKPHELAMLGRLTDLEVSRRTGRPRVSVYKKRRSLRISCLGRFNPWTRESLSWLGKLPDKEIARRIGCHYKSVHGKRTALQIPNSAARFRQWTKAEDALLGTGSDRDVASKLNRTVKGVALRREKLGIAANNPAYRIWTKAQDSLLGKYPTRNWRDGWGAQSPRCIIGE
jgi:hypothetical protein